MKEYICNLLVKELVCFPNGKGLYWGYLLIFEREGYWSIFQWCTSYRVLLIVCFCQQISTPLGQNIRYLAGAGVLFRGSVGQAPWTNKSAGGCGHCSLGSNFGLLVALFNRAGLFRAGVMLVSDSHVRLMVSGRQFWKTAPAGWSGLQLVMVSASISKWVRMSAGSFGRQLQGLTVWWWSPAHCWWWSLSASGSGCQLIWWACDWVHGSRT